MIFRYRGRDYSLSVFLRPPIRFGDAKSFWVDRARGLFCIDADVPVENRHWTVMQLFKDVTGDDSNAFGAMLDQYEEFGGRSVVEAMECFNGRSTSARETPKSPGGKMTCPCLREVVGGSIVNDAPEWIAALGVWSVRRTMYCSGCEDGYTWGETATESGQPLGEFLGGAAPRKLTSEELREFLGKHPHLRMELVYT